LPKLRENGSYVLTHIKFSDFNITWIQKEFFDSLNLEPLGHRSVEIEFNSKYTLGNVFLS
jgi:hypothetical protein